MRGSTVAPSVLLGAATVLALVLAGLWTLGKRGRLAWLSKSGSTTFNAISTTRGLGIACAVIASAFALVYGTDPVLVLFALALADMRRLMGTLHVRTGKLETDFKALVVSVGSLDTRTGELVVAADGLTSRTGQLETKVDTLVIKTSTVGEAVNAVSVRQVADANRTEKRFDQVDLQIADLSKGQSEAVASWFSIQPPPVQQSKIIKINQVENLDRMVRDSVDTALEQCGIVRPRTPGMTRSATRESVQVTTPHSRRTSPSPSKRTWPSPKRLLFSTPAQDPVVAVAPTRTSPEPFDKLAARSDPADLLEWLQIRMRTTSSATFKRGRIYAPPAIMSSSGAYKGPHTIRDLVACSSEQLSSLASDYGLLDDLTEPSDIRALVHVFLTGRIWQPAGEVVEDILI